MCVQIFDFSNQKIPFRYVNHVRLLIIETNEIWYLTPKSRIALNVQYTVCNLSWILQWGARPIFHRYPGIIVSFLRFTTTSIRVSVNVPSSILTLRVFESKNIYSDIEWKYMVSFAVYTLTNASISVISSLSFKQSSWHWSRLNTFVLCNYWKSYRQNKMLYL